MLILPIAAVLIGHIRLFIPLAVIGVAVGRALMPAASALTTMSAAALTVGAGLLYIALIVRHRANALPYFFLLGFAADQIFRAVGNTFDPSWSPTYADVQLRLSVVVILFSMILVFWESRRARLTDEEVDPSAMPDTGLLPFWSAIGLGATLFLEISLLALPNAIAGRGGLDYTLIAPFLLVATLLPILPFVRGRARATVSLFDGGARGWLWLLLTVLAIILALRVPGAGGVLVVAQFFISMSWWWLTRPKAQRERNYAGLWLLFTILVFGALVVADNFTYEYAFVRNLGGDFRFLNDIVPPLLRGFRGLGLGVILLATFLTLLPMLQTRRRIPWGGGSMTGNIFGLLIIAGAAAGITYAVQPPVVEAVRNVDEIRVATYNIHSGFSEFYAYDLEAVARTIQQSGANVILLQEIEAGRMTSFGVDQPLWLARRLRMDRRFFPTNEGLQGLAVLSNIPIAFDDGTLLSSLGAQTGVQRVQITPEANVVITVYNTWLSPLLEIPENQDDDDTAAQEQDQQRQLNQLFGVVATHHPNGVLGRTVIGGTFNNVPDSDLLQQMRIAGFQDPFAGYPIELGATFVRVGLPRARFDYLWLRNLPAGGVGVVESVASDHRLAMTGVTINR
jgi:endonuclease/exonuclease/phosphatase family metal-dependent hydrolase